MVFFNEVKHRLLLFSFEKIYSNVANSVKNYKASDPYIRGKVLNLQKSLKFKSGKQR
jgi:hypothetical protein